MAEFLILRYDLSRAGRPVSIAGAIAGPAPDTGPPWVPVTTVEGTLDEEAPELLERAGLRPTEERYALLRFDDRREIAAATSFAEVDPLPPEVARGDPPAKEPVEPPAPAEEGPFPAEAMEPKEPPPEEPPAGA